MCSGGGSPCGGGAAIDTPTVAGPSADVGAQLAAIIPPVALGATWAGTPGQRGGMATLGVQLTDDHVLAQTQGGAGVVTATDPLAWALRQMGFTPGDATAAAGDALGVGAVGPVPDAGAPAALSLWATAGVLIAALVILAAGAFAVARGD